MTGILSVLLLALASLPREGECVSCLTCGLTGGLTEQEKLDCVEGTNLEGIDCEANGWGSSCITRAYWTYSTQQMSYLRSCVGAPPMTCEEGHVMFWNSNELWTACCDTDDCNDYDPRDATTTTELDTTTTELDTTTTELVDTTTDTISEGLRCVRCTNLAGVGDTEEDIKNCEEGTDLEDTSEDCEAGNWSNMCITRFYMRPTGNNLWIRTCVGSGMTCEEGHVVIGEGFELFTACCDTDNCNVYDPRDVIITDSPTTTTEVDTTTTDIVTPTTEETTIKSDETTTDYDETTTGGSSGSRLSTILGLVTVLISVL